MMKVRPILFALVGILVLLGGANYSYAVPVQGVVDPGSNWASTLTGTATYTFTNLVGGTNAPMVGLGLGFAGDVFNLGSTQIIASSVSSGWNLVTLGNGAYELDLLSGSAISAGSSLSFSATYSLIGSALTKGIDPWQQTFAVLFAGSPWVGSGVTSSNVPEASSLILLVLAVAGLVLWKRKQESTLNG
jgi:protein-S-isoprenylcysteine O-methyltransferase Ste14